jgi:hypothetical protein
MVSEKSTDPATSIDLDTLSCQCGSANLQTGAQAMSSKGLHANAMTQSKLEGPSDAELWHLEERLEEPFRRLRWCDAVSRQGVFPGEAGGVGASSTSRRRPRQRRHHWGEARAGTRAGTQGTVRPPPCTASAAAMTPTSARCGCTSRRRRRAGGGARRERRVPAGDARAAARRCGPPAAARRATHLSATPPLHIALGPWDPGMRAGVTVSAGPRATRP